MKCVRSPDSRTPNDSLRGIVHSLIRVEVFVLRHGPAGTIPGSSVSVVENLDICKPAARDRTLPFPSDLQVGTFNLIIASNAMETTTRETLRRPGPLLHCLYALHSTPTSSSCITSTSTSPTPDTTITPIHLHSNSCTETCTSPANRDHVASQEVSSQDVDEGITLPRTDLEQDQSRPVMRPVGRSVDWSAAVDDQLADEDVMQISGAGHWFLEGWIGDHAVDFLVDSGSEVIAMSCSFYKALVEAGAPVGDLRPTARKLRCANDSQIDILGCSSCVVSFLGLRTEFPILVCDLSTDAIIGTDTLGSILPHTLDIRHGLLFTEGGVALHLQRRDAALSGRVFTVGHCSIPPYSEAVLHCTTRTVGGQSMPPSGLLEGLTVFSENTGLVVGRTLVDPSGWKVPVLVPNFVQETVMVEPFSEIGMIAQV